MKAPTSYSNAASWINLAGWAWVLSTPATLLLAPLVWLLKRDLDNRAAQLDWRTGLSRREHAIFNPGLPFELHPPQNTTFTAHPSYRK